MATYDFTGAMKILETTKTDTSNAEATNLRAVILFVEERPVEAFRELARARRIAGDGLRLSARAYLQAGNAIVREKDRCAEVTVLLDSAVTLDPGLRESAIDLAFQRGMEYLGMSGDAGYRLIKYADKLDPEAHVRLRGKDVALSSRYAEMSATDQGLPAVQQAAGGFLAQTGRLPATIEELRTLIQVSPMVARSAWIYSFAMNAPRVTVEARIRPGNPFGIPNNTMLKVW